MIVEVEVPSQAALRFMKVGVVVQVDLLVFHAAPQTFDKDVVETAAAAVHADADPGFIEPAGEIVARELAALVCVEDLGPARVKGLVERINAERRVQRVREPPGQYVVAPEKVGFSPFLSGETYLPGIEILQDSTY